MSSLNKLKSASDIYDMAAALGLKTSALAYILYKLPAAQKYSTFEIPKKSGGARTIMAPDDRLKLAQRRLSDLLLACQEEIEAEQKIDDSCTLAHGFKPRFSISTNAEKHRNRRWVFNTDIKDFFPSINFGRVFGFFQKNQFYALKKPIATMIAQIACYENQLPQGSPCSPVISNIIAHILDIHLGDLAARNNCTYTRYADDITFSTNERRFPRAIARRDEDDDHKWAAGSKLKKIIKANGFKLNSGKTRMQYCDSRQEVTGLVVNEKVNVKQSYYKHVRALTHTLVNGKSPFEVVGGKKIKVGDEQLQGKLNFVYFIKSSENERAGMILDKEHGPTPNFHKVYGQFLDYKWFYGIGQPTLLCEGKTDNIYLKAAIKARQAKFPNLKVNFFSYSDISAKVQNLSGGTGELNSLLSTYRKRISSFKSGGKHPLIIGADNDSGATKLYSHIKNILDLGKPVDGNDQFYYVYENLYVVFVPRVAGGQTAIENLFSKTLLNTKVDGKSFDITGKKDPAKFYFKNDFAVRVVKAGGAKIKFNGFDPLLAAIEAVKADFAKRLAATP
jgi:RNA-directed DNA polymerase